VRSLPPPPARPSPPALPFGQGVKGSGLGRREKGEGGRRIKKINFAYST